MAENNPEGDIKAIGQEGIEPPIEVSLPDIPNLHEAHCASMAWKYGSSRHACVPIETQVSQADKSSV